MNALKDFEQRRWEQDIATHVRYVEYAAACKTDRCRDFFLERAAAIQARYPRYIKAADLSPTGEA